MQNIGSPKPRFRKTRQQPFTGVPRGPRRKVTHGELLECFWAPGSECPKALNKHSVGHFPAQAHGHSCKWRLGSQTFRRWPMGSPVNGGWDRKLSLSYLGVNSGRFANGYFRNGHFGLQCEERRTFFRGLASGLFFCLSEGSSLFPPFLFLNGAVLGILKVPVRKAPVCVLLKLMEPFCETGERQLAPNSVI